MAAESTPGARNADAWIAHAVNGALSGAVRIGLAGLGFALLAVWLVATAALPRALAVAPLAVALAELWLLLRVAIDHRLFDALAASCTRDGHADLAGLDRALTELGWIAPARAGRPLPERARGAMRLVRASAALAALQLALALLISMLR
ncbi:hypothetical protein [Cupriavidus necator]|uniref:hypothetical protein n=1 Tax=Cupriavidus necator TaxID=106590 RepID=UPI00339D3230